MKFLSQMIGVFLLSLVMASPVWSSAPAAATQASATTHHQTEEGVAPETALKWLKNGNARYLKANYRKDGKGMSDRTRLKTGQKPHTIVLSCADSRVPPEHVFDQALGEIFVVRVAGEALDTSVIASIEYAVEHLGSRLIVVMGHTECGAVKAALTTKPGSSAGSPSLDRLVEDLRPRLGREPASTEMSQGVALESASNAKGIAKDLSARSEIIREKVTSGHVQIRSALYSLATGSVDFH